MVFFKTSIFKMISQTRSIRTMHALNVSSIPVWILQAFSLVFESY